MFADIKTQKNNTFGKISKSLFLKIDIFLNQSPLDHSEVLLLVSP